MSWWQAQRRRSGREGMRQCNVRCDMSDLEHLGHLGNVGRECNARGFFENEKFNRHRTWNYEYQLPSEWFS